MVTAFPDDIMLAKVRHERAVSSASGAMTRSVSHVINTNEDVNLAADKAAFAKFKALRGRIPQGIRGAL